MVHQNTRNRRNGARFETDLVSRFRANGVDAERTRLSGNQDEGDLAVRLAQDVRLVIEAKSAKALRVRYWYEEEAIPEARHYAGKRGLEKAYPILVMKTHGKSLDHALVTLSLKDFEELTLR